jgi:dGTPase
MEDIIKLSVNNIYRSREVVEKEVIGYRIINTLLDTFCTAYNNKAEGRESNYDLLVLKLLPERFAAEKMSVYDRLLHICHFVSTLTDGKAVLLYNTITGAK